MKKIKDIQSALALFEESAIKQAESTEIGDYKSGNKAYKSLIHAINFLKELEHVPSLNAFLYHSNVGVRIWAATYLLPFNEANAIIVLEDISKRRDIFSLDAETTLSEWRKGNLKL